MEAIKRFLKDEKGITSIEYALLAVGIALAIGAAAALLGGKIANLYNTISSSISS